MRTSLGRKNQRLLFEPERMTETVMMNWGTWEELLLGGAVLRHGTRAWDAVASELRSRTLSPFSFTAEVCKAKYEDLRERYCGCNAWFEELRRQRVAELKRELEKSEDSIGSLETKLETLTAEKEEDINIKYNSSQTESPISDGSTEGVGFSGKEISISKDGLSAGSFTEETRPNWSPESQIPANVSTQENENQEEEERENSMNFETIGGGGNGRISNLRKRRGKRKRKDCNNHKEASVESTADAVMVDFDQSMRSFEKDDWNDLTVENEEDVDLMKIFNSFIEDENSAVFRIRLDSQRRAKYKKTIRRHLDFNNIRSRINNRSMMTMRELHRDLLLLSNNALVYYPKDSREYASAICIRDLANKTFRQDHRVSGKESGGDSGGGGGGGDSGSGGGGGCFAVSDEPSKCNLPVKPRSVRPRSRKVNGKTTAAEESNSSERENKKASDVEIAVESSSSPAEAVKRVTGRTGKAGRGSAVKRPETPAKGRRKRPRRR